MDHLAERDRLRKPGLRVGRECAYRWSAESKAARRQLLERQGLRKWRLVRGWLCLEHEELVVVDALGRVFTELRTELLGGRLIGVLDRRSCGDADELVRHETWRPESEVADRRSSESIGQGGRNSG